jgi:hypothetical protein
MIAAGLQLFLWVVGLFKKKPPNPTEVVEKTDDKMLADAANRPTDVNSAIDKL